MNFFVQTKIRMSILSHRNLKNVYSYSKSSKKLIKNLQQQIRVKLPWPKKLSSFLLTYSSAWLCRFAAGCSWGCCDLWKLLKLLSMFLGCFWNNKHACSKHLPSKVGMILYFIIFTIKHLSLSHSSKPCQMTISFAKNKKLNFD